MIVVSNTSPLNYLTLINQTELLPRLFERIVIPEAVRDELRHPGSPDSVKRWIGMTPNWLQIRKVSRVQSAATLGAGETEAISLAVQLNADLVLLDDSKARKTAHDKGLKIAGVLNVLALAASRDLIDINDAISQLRQTNFRASAAIIKTIIEQNEVR